MKKKDLLANSFKNPGKMIDGSLFEVDGVPVLESDLILDHTYKPKLARHFTYPGGWQTYYPSTDTWTKEKLATLRHYCQNKTNSYSKAERTFLSAAGCGNFANAEWLEDDVSYHKRLSAEERKLKRIKEKLEKLTPAIPTGVMPWIKRNAFKVTYGFTGEYDVEKKAIVRKTITCGRCHTQFENPHKRIVFCPECNRMLSVTTDSEKRTSEYFTVLQKANDGRILERRFVATSWQQAGVHSDDISEIVRGFGEQAGHTWSEWYYGLYVGRVGKAQSFYDKKEYRTFPVYNAKGYIYLPTMEAAGASESAIRCADLERQLGIKSQWSGHMLIVQEPAAEYVLRSGWSRLIKEWTNYEIRLDQQATTPWGMLGIGKRDYKLLKELDASPALRKAFNIPGIKDEHIKALAAMPKTCALKVIETAEDYELPIGHLATLLKGCNEHQIREYRDYLDMAKQRRANIHDEIIYRNKRWKEFHDRYAEEIAEKKNKKRRSEANKKFPEIAAAKEDNTWLYGFQSKQYLFTVPAKAGDIITEGQLQHHCVGASDTYLKRMKDGVSAIVFMRLLSNPKAPYYTIEIDNTGKVLQAYGAFDRKPDWDEVKPVVDRWSKEVRKKLKLRAAQGR